MSKLGGVWRWWACLGQMATRGAGWCEPKCGLTSTCTVVCCDHGGGPRGDAAYLQRSRIIESGRFELTCSMASFTLQKVRLPLPDCTSTM